MSDRMPPSVKPVRQPTPSVQQRLFRHQRFWLQLATYRPLVVLASIWIGLLAIALLAFGQLTHNASDEQNSPTPTSTEVYPHERMQGKDTPAQPAPSPSAATDSSARATPALAPGVAPSPVQGLSGWTLLALVGSCAVGSWLLSVLIRMPRRPKKRRSQRAKLGKKYRLAPPEGASATAAATPMAASSQAPTVPKLDIYDPDQPLVATAQPPSTPPSTTSAARPDPIAPTDVSVVSSQTQHRLDWPSDSLVNTADVRQRRSLSSFL